MKLDQRCKKCGETLRRLMLLAMMMDAGASVSPSPLDCEHDFEAEKEKCKGCEQDFEKEELDEGFCCEECHAIYENPRLLKM